MVLVYWVISMLKVELVFMLVMLQVSFEMMMSDGNDGEGCG